MIVQKISGKADEGPVPKVEGVGDVSQVGDRLSKEKGKAVHPLFRMEEDEAGGETGDGAKEWIGGVVRREQREGNQDANPPHGGKQRGCNLPSESALHEEGERSHGELPATAERGEEVYGIAEKPSCSDFCQQAEDEDCDDNLPGSEMVSSGSAVSSVDMKEEEQRGRPDEIELFFHPERPSVKQRVF